METERRRENTQGSSSGFSPSLCLHVNPFFRTAGRADQGWRMADGGWRMGLPSSRRGVGGPEWDAGAARVRGEETQMDPRFLSAKRQAALIRRGAINCRALIDDDGGRVQRLDGRINMIVVREFERARKRAGGSNG